MRQLVWVTALTWLWGCSSGSPTTPSDLGGPPAAGQPVYSRHRDLSTGNIEPVLSAGDTGMPTDEIDSPAVVRDPDRADGNEFLLYFEASLTGGGNSIGVVLADEPDLEGHGPAATAIAAGPSGSGLEFGATDPTVVVDSRPVANPPLGQRRYQMWFEGRGGTNGGQSKIFRSLSVDGVHWSTPLECSGLTAAFGSVRIADPTVVLDGSVYRMWFEAIGASTPTGADGPGVFGYAESTDGLQWTVIDAAGGMGNAATFVFGPGVAGGFDGYGVYAPSVVLDASRPQGDPNRFLLWYEAADRFPDSENSIGFATSADGLSWTRFDQPVLRPSSDSIVPLPFDSGDLEHPAALLDPDVPAGGDGRFLLWYAADSEASQSTNRIGFASGAMQP